MPAARAVADLDREISGDLPRRREPRRARDPRNELDRLLLARRGVHELLVDQVARLRGDPDGDLRAHLLEAARPSVRGLRLPDAARYARRGLPGLGDPPRLQ